MRTRSQSRNSNRQQQQVNPTFIEPFNLVEPIENQAPPVVTIDDTRTMAQLLEAPIVGYEDAIVVPEITADNFELKHGLLILVQNKQFFGHDKEDPHAHIRYFNKITYTMKFPNVPSTSVKLMLFLFSLEGAARIWLEKEPPRSILTWDDLVSKFINKFFPPSKTTNLRNEITRFQQRFDETFYKAWDRFNDLLRACPHHGFSELHQLDTFYNALNYNDQDSLNSAAGGNFLDKMPRDCLRIIESRSKVRNSRNKPVVAKVSLSSSTPGTDISQKDEKPIKKRQNRTRDGKVCGDEAKSNFVVIEMSCEEYSQEGSGFLAIDFLLEEVDAFLALEDDPIHRKTDVEEKAALIKVLKSYKRAIAWKLSDIKGYYPEFCTHKILMEEDYKPAVQHQRRVNPKIYDVIKKEVEKLLDAGLIYPISDSPWVSPVHYVPKKGGFTVVENDENELISTRLVTGWRICIDYRKLNEATRKDHFPLPFMDQMLERLAGNEYYCFLDGFSGYIQIPIDPHDQEKITFTYPYGTFAYRRMHFGLCNAPGTFQRCMMDVFHDMIEKTMEVFMDDFSVFGNSFGNCLSRVDKMLQRCEDTNLYLNLEKSNYMVKEGIVLGHKISKNGIEVDKEKVDVIVKLPHPTTVKGVQSFLGHAGFYRRFIKDFSNISRPMNHLLEKNTPFIFFDECIQAFETLKKKLTEAPILIAPDLDLPFELMCDASNFAIGAVLGQRHEKHFRPIHYASKTINKAKSHYTTTEKEMLAVVVEETCKTKVKTPAIPEWQNLTDMISQNFVNTNKASTSVSGTLPGTLVTNQSLRSKQEKLSEMAKKIETKLARQRVILNKLPKKNWRPRQIPFIPCEFSAVNMQCLGRILVQASILCRISCGKDLFFRVLPQTCLTLELEDRSIHNTNRIDKDVRVLVGKFQFPADFVVVEFEPDPRVPLILGRCFLKTSRALIDVHEGEITLRVGKEAINFQS
ncbi:reverse transcriptase domain-containing protein [Tanacetum coccineum]